MKLVRLLSVLVLSVAVSACSSSSSADPAPPAAAGVSATVAVPPTPVALSVEQAAERYLDLVEPLNAAIRALADGEQPWDPVGRQAFVDAADACRTFGVALDRVAWPAEVVEAVDALERSTAELQVALRGALLDDVPAGTTLGDMLTTRILDVAERGAADAELVRQKLGLPAAPAVGSKP